MHTDVAWQDSGRFSTIMWRKHPQTPLNIVRAVTQLHACTGSHIRKETNVGTTLPNFSYSLNHAVYKLPHLCWGVPHTCCQGRPPPAWQRSSPLAWSSGPCRAGWQRGIRFHTWGWAAPLSWWDAGSGRTLWWSRALSIQKEGHTEHAQHHSLEIHKPILV